MEVKDKNSIWTEISVAATWDVAELVAETMETLDCEGVVLGELPEPKEGEPAVHRKETVIKGYLSGYHDPEPVKAALAVRLKELSGFGLETGEARISARSVDQEDWAHAWKAYFHPVEISPTLVVKPTWEPYQAKAHQRVIEIDPGMAFGTGTHPTTQLCLRLMETHLRPEAEILDVGCGSGILAILGAKLGGRVTAIDNDPLATHVTQENALLNGVSDRIFAQTAELGTIISEFDMVVANILAEVIVEIAPLIPGRLKPGGIFIGSGIIQSKGEWVASALARQGLKILERQEQEGWVALVAVK